MEPKSSGTIRCPVCDSNVHRRMFSLSKGHLDRCLQCNLVFYLPRPTSKELEEYYNSLDYRNSYCTGEMTGISFANKRYQQFSSAIAKYESFSYLPDNQILLDIGCGTGDFLYEAAQHGWEVEGFEISELAAAQANKLLGSTVVRSGSIDNLQFSHDKYDVISSYHVIEHLLDPVSMLHRVYELLRPGGIVFLETPNISSFGARMKGSNWSHIIPPEHITYFDQSSVRYALEKVGFSDVYTYTITPQKIESLRSFPRYLSPAVKMIYQIAPFFNLGATLQAIARKS